MINEGEEVFVLPFSALDSEYLFWKYRRTRFEKWGYLKIRLVSRHTKKRRTANQKKTGEKMFQQKCLGIVWGLRYESTTLALRQYEGSTPPFGRSKYIPAQTTFRQQKDNLNYIYVENGVNLV